MELTNLRNKNGAMMGFIIVSLIVLIILAVAFFQFSMLIGGNRELANAVDSGTLNTGRLATTVKVEIQPGTFQEQFSDVAEDNGKSFSLESINRMWAKCLLCLMNEKAMESEQSSNSASATHAGSLFQAASNISDRLSERLNDQNYLKDFFKALVERESLRMLGNKASVAYEKGTGWKTSLMDRNVESNVAIYQEQLPGSFKLKDNLHAVIASDGKHYFPGYEPIDVLNHNYVTFVPFKLKSQPHLVAGVDFNKDTFEKSKIAHCSSHPVPNAFSCQGMTKSQNLGVQHCKSFVLTNPQTTYDLTIPHSYIHILLDTNTAHFCDEGVPHPEFERHYGYNSSNVVFAAIPHGLLSHLEITSVVGLEFGSSVWSALAALDDDYGPLVKVLTQRCAEMKHGFKESDVLSLLQNTSLSGATDYYIFPDSKGNIQASSSPPPWMLLGSQADGQESKICSASLASTPNVITTHYTGMGVSAGNIQESDAVYWTPGTGFNGCLGNVRVTHDTWIFAWVVGI
jgi:hypothetical protein